MDPASALRFNHLCSPRHNRVRGIPLRFASGKISSKILPQGITLQTKNCYNLVVKST